MTAAEPIWGLSPGWNARCTGVGPLIQISSCGDVPAAARSMWAVKSAQNHGFPLFAYPM